MERTVHIYALYDPRNPGDMRYVGMTTKTMEQRRLGHSAEGRKTKGRGYTYHWLRKMHREGVEPSARLLDTYPFDTGSYWENVWWWALKLLGHPIINREPGIHGPWPIIRDHRPKSAEHRAALSAARRGMHFPGHPCTPETRTKIGQANRGHTDKFRGLKRPPEVGGKIAKTKRQHPESVARGDRHGTRTKPESVRRGNDHWTHTKPELLARGEQSGAAKLTAATVLDARYLHAVEQWSYSELGRHMGVTNVAMRYVIQGRTWKHVTEDTIPYIDELRQAMLTTSENAEALAQRWSVPPERVRRWLYRLKNLDHHSHSTP